MYYSIYIKFTKADHVLGQQRNLHPFKSVEIMQNSIASWILQNHIPSKEQVTHGDLYTNTISHYLKTAAWVHLGGGINTSTFCLGSDCSGKEKQGGQWEVRSVLCEVVRARGWSTTPNTFATLQKASKVGSVGYGWPFPNIYQTLDLNYL